MASAYPAHSVPRDTQHQVRYPAPPPPVKQPAKHRAPIGVLNTSIEGGYRRITTHQLALAWWLYQSGQITRRQLRVYFASHEMAERRTPAAIGPREGQDRARRPSFTLEEVAALVGGKGSPEALAALKTDIKRLGKLGLMQLTPHSISFATSADQINIPDLKGYWAMYGQFRNASRSVPVPRRMLRSLAGGFSRAVTAVIIATLIRSLFWHKESGQYRMDGRTKASWIVQTFGVSRRAVTDARATLIDLGWLEPIATKQWEMNRWGSHDAINSTWAIGRRGGGAERKRGREMAPDAVTPKISDTSESASPPAQNHSESASPLNRSSSPSGNTNTRNPARPGHSGVSRNSQGSERSVRPKRPPLLRDVGPEHLGNTADLLELYRQATHAGIIDTSEASELTFLAFAERARAHGTRPGALFTWLLRGKRTQFITQADEDAAHVRLREHRNAQGAIGKEGWPVAVERAGEKPRELTEDERFYELCHQIAKRERLEDPFRVAFIGKRWTRPKWEEVRAGYESLKSVGQDQENCWNRPRSVASPIM